MTEQIWLWVGFNVSVLAMLALDLGVFHRQAHVVSFKESRSLKRRTEMWFLAVSSGIASVFQPGGRQRVAQRFIAGTGRQRGQVPSGTTEAQATHLRLPSLSCVPPGLGWARRPFPAMNRWAIFKRP